MRVVTLAEKVGVTRQYIGMIERDEVESPGVNLIVGIAHALAVDVREILKGART